MLTTAHEITSTVQGGAIPRFAIDVSGLVKTYDQIRVVDGLDLRVDTGQIFGLLGANGAGKTTAVECLQGLRRPDAGRLRVLGLDPIGDRDRLRLLVGSQLQDSALPDLILLDLSLPRKSGFELLEEIRASDSLKRIPVIILSGSADPIGVHRAYELHANCYIRKPNDLDELLSMIKTCYRFWGRTVHLPPKTRPS